MKKNYSRSKYLNILGLSDPVTGKDIKSAYLVKTKQYHPDINKNVC